MQRGTLRIFLGAAPGVGKTYAMLEEAHQLKANGTDVVVGVALDHGRRATHALINGLEAVPARQLEYRGAMLAEMDVDAVLARKPAVAIVDEYAHSNVPGSRNTKRWQDVEELLDAGIDVVSTVNIQHLASLGDVVSAITEVRQAETVPDEVVRRADQIELVDISPELLRQRLSAGNVYATDKVDAALANYFRMGNLSALREIALIWLADRVDEGLEKYRASHGIEASWPARERVVVGLTGGPEGEVLLRRASRILSRVSGGDLMAVHVIQADGVAGESPKVLEAHRQLATDLGGSYHTVAGDDPAEALLGFARNVNATQIVVGVSRRKLVPRLLGGSGVGSKVVRDSGDIDVHMVSHPLGGQGLPRLKPGLLGKGRTVAGFALAVLVPVLATLMLSPFTELNFATHVLVHLTGVIAVAFVGGLWPAVLAALLDSLLLNYFAAEPVGTFTVDDPQNFFALVVFLGVAVAVSLVVGLSARRSKEARLARSEASTLEHLARGALIADDTVPAFLEQVRETFHVRSVALFVRDDDGGPPSRGTRAGGVAGNGGHRPWTREATAGDDPPQTPDAADNVELANETTALTLSGRTLTSGDRRLLTAHGAHLLALRQRQDLKSSLRDNIKLAEGNKIRTSILRAVSHDLRTPMAGIKLAVTALRRQRGKLPEDVEVEMLETIESFSDRLDALVDNLLDMSRISSDSVTPLLAPVTWREAVDLALVGIPAGRVRVDLPPNMPPVEADRGMLERVIANTVENAVKYAGDSDIVIVGSVGGVGSAQLDGEPASELRIVDHGQGVPAKDVVEMFRPFQRLDDAPAGLGVGLGLAVAKGFAEAMGGQLEAEATPGGGLTMVVRLPLSTGFSAQDVPSAGLKGATE